MGEKEREARRDVVGCGSWGGGRGRRGTGVVLELTDLESVLDPSGSDKTWPRGWERERERVSARMVYGVRFVQALGRN
jgi:hypothetical protein